MANSITSTGDPALGARLRALRENAGLSIYDVARQTDREIKPSTLSAYERGERAVSVARLIRLAEIYGVSASDLLVPPGS